MATLFSRYPYRIRVLCFFSSLLILVACSTVDVQESVNISSSLAPEEGIALLSADLSKATDKEVYDCIGERIRSKQPNLALVSAEMVRVDLYRKDKFVSPDMDNSFFETFNKLMNNPYKRKKIESLNLRYIVFVNITPFQALEDVESSSWAPILYSKSGGITHGFIGCGAGQGAGGCLGLMAWDMDASLSTVVMDLQNLTIAAKLDVIAKGHGLMPAFILPVPIPLAMPYSRACSEMTKKLEQLFLGGSAKKSNN